MDVVIVSDNHGKKQILKDIVNKHPHASAYIHCGDSEMDKVSLLPFDSVVGNNDYYSELPEYQITKVGSTRILWMHSHTLPYGKAVEALVSLAKKQGCDVACYGHTHRYDARTIDGVLVINPGSLYYNRDRSNPSYAVLTIDDNGFSVQRFFAEDVKKTL